MANLGKTTDNSTAMKNRSESKSDKADKNAGHGRTDKPYGQKDDFEPMKVKPTEEPEEEDQEDDMPEDTGIQSNESSQKDLGKGTFGGKPYGKKDDVDNQRSGISRNERPERGERPSGFGTGRGDIGKSGKDAVRGKKAVAHGASQQTTYGDDEEDQ